MINDLLKTGTVDGRIRVYLNFFQTKNLKERIQFLKGEFGWYGRTLSIQGSTFSMMDSMPSKGIRILATVDGKEHKKIYKWKEIAERLEFLIAKNEYLTAEEKDRIKVYETKATDKIQSQTPSKEQTETEVKDEPDKAEEITLFDMDDFEATEEPLQDSGYGSEVAFVPMPKVEKPSVSVEKQEGHNVTTKGSNHFSFPLESLDAFYPKGTKDKIHANVGDILESDPEIHIPEYVYKRFNGGYRDKPIITPKNGKAPTCVAHYAKDRSTRLVDDGKRIRPYSVLEYQRLQGFPDWFKFEGTDNDAYRQIGNAVPVDMGR